MQLALMPSASSSTTQLRPPRSKKGSGVGVLADDGVMPIGDYGGEDMSDDDSFDERGVSLLDGDDLRIYGTAEIDDGPGDDLNPTTRRR